MARASPSTIVRCAHRTAREHAVSPQPKYCHPMTGQRAAAATLLVLALGCGNKKQQCQADVADLADYLRKLKYESFTVSTSAKLVTRSDVPDPTQAAPVLDLLPNGAQMNGKPIDLSSLQQQLIDESMSISRSGANARNAQTAPTVLFAIDEATPWHTVAEMAEAAASSGFNHVGFVFAAPATVQPPPHTSVDDEVAKLGTAPGEKAAGLAKLLKDISAPCKPIQDVFSNLATYSTGDKSEIYASGVSKALLECDCGIDLPRFRSASYYLFTAPPTRSLTVTVSRDGAPLAFPANTPWREVSKQLKANTVASFSVQ